MAGAQVVAGSPHLAARAPQRLAPTAHGNGNDPIYLGVQCRQQCKAFFHHPVDMRIRNVFVNVRYNGEIVQHIAHGGGLDQ